MFLDSVCAELTGPTPDGVRDEFGPKSPPALRAPERFSLDFRVRSGMTPAACRAHGELIAPLAGSVLQSKFYGWRGVSGALHPCKIAGFEKGFLIPLLSRVMVIGVARDALRVRPVCFLSSEEFDTAEGVAIRDQALAAGCTEWHLYFQSAPAKLYDLAAAFMS